MDGLDIRRIWDPSFYNEKDWNFYFIELPSLFHILDINKEIEDYCLSEAQNVGGG